jgi:hypothetical protein
MYSDDEHVNPVSGVSGLTVPRAAAVVVIGALVLLILIKRGFHPRVSVSVK